MKNLFKIAAFLGLVMLNACDSFDQRAFDEGLEDSNKLDYVKPESTPVTQEEFAQFVHGASQNHWVAQEFSLESLLGSQDCRLDDSMILSQDGTYEFDGGEMSCGGGDVSSKSGVYIIDFENKQLIFDEGSSNEVLVEIEGLSEGVILLKSEVDIFGIPMSIEGVYTIAQ
jgi:hypothetical protein